MSEANKNNFELCVSCNKPTKDLKDTDIESRLYYVRGAGQLCPECWWKLYGK